MKRLFLVFSICLALLLSSGMGFAINSVDAANATYVKITRLGPVAGGDNGWATVIPYSSWGTINGQKIIGNTLNIEVETDGSWSFSNPYIEFGSSVSSSMVRNTSNTIRNGKTYRVYTVSPISSLNLSRGINYSVVFRTWSFINGQTRAIEYSASMVQVE